MLAEMTASLGIWEIDVGTGTVTLSAELAVQLGLARSVVKLQRRQVYALVHRDDRTLVRTALEKALAAKELFRAEFRVVLKNGNVRWFRTQGRLERDGGKLSALLAFRLTQPRKKQTLAELEAARKTAEKASQAKTEFLSTMSHELRTPLTTLRGYTELLLHRDYTKERQHQFLEIIRQECDRLNRLISTSSLDLQRIEAGREAYRFEYVDAGVLLRETAEFFGNASHKHSFDVQLGNSDLSVWADSDALRQAFVQS